VVALVAIGLECNLGRNSGSSEVSLFTESSVSGVKLLVRNKIWPVREHQNMSKCLHHRNYIASYLNYITTMGRKRAFGDAGLVRPPSRVATMGGRVYVRHWRGAGKSLFGSSLSNQAIRLASLCAEAL
jgi:hypothetical protein